MGNQRLQGRIPRNKRDKVIICIFSLLLYGCNDSASNWNITNNSNHKSVYTELWKNDSIGKIEVVCLDKKCKEKQVELISYSSGNRFVYNDEYKFSIKLDSIYYFNNDVNVMEKEGGWIFKKDEVVGYEVDTVEVSKLLKKRHSYNKTYIFNKRNGIYCIDSIIPNEHFNSIDDVPIADKIYIGFPGIGFVKKESIKNVIELNNR